MVHPASLPLDRLKSECSVSRTRRGGPGGQHRNKVSTAVVISHLPTGVVSEANERRSQQENMQVAFQRLRIQLALAVREPVTSTRATSPIWSKYGRGKQISINAENVDFPVVLAEALDYLAANEFEPAAAADKLKITPSQLLKLMRQEPAAWVLLCEQRKRMDKKPLR